MDTVKIKVPPQVSIVAHEEQVFIPVDGYIQVPQAVAKALLGSHRNFEFIPPAPRIVTKEKNVR